MPCVRQRWCCLHLFSRPQNLYLPAYLYIYILSLGRIESGRIESGRIEWERIEWGRIKPDRIEWGRIEWGRIEWERIEWGRLEWVYIPFIVLLIIPTKDNLKDEPFELVSLAGCAINLMLNKQLRITRASSWVHSLPSVGISI